MSELTFQLLKEKHEDDKNKPVKPFESMNECPFCSSSDLTVRDNEGFFWGHCINCLSNGPLRHDRLNAIKTWNGRFLSQGKASA